MNESYPEGVVWVPAQRLLALSPVGRPFWCEDAVSEDMVWQAVDEGRCREHPVPDALYTRAWAHAERVAEFVIRGIPDFEAIEIDVGAPSFGCHVEEPVQDGNHRLAGALIRGDNWIPCSISGSEEEISRRFGWRVAEELFDPRHAAHPIAC